MWKYLRLGQFSIYLNRFFSFSVLTSVLAKHVPCVLNTHTHLIMSYFEISIKMCNTTMFYSEKFGEWVTKNNIVLDFFLAFNEIQQFSYLKHKQFTEIDCYSFDFGSYVLLNDEFWWVVMRVCVRVIKYLLHFLSNEKSIFHFQCEIG